MSIVTSPLPDRIPCDRSGAPIGHQAAMEKVLGEFMDMVNELPESVYHLNRTDAAWIAENLIGRYLQNVARER